MKLNTTVGNVQIKIDVPLDERVRSAQRLLNEQVVVDCDPLIPFRQGALRNSVNFPQGIYGGEIEYNTPYARYQYMGEVYSPSIPIKDSNGNITAWFSPKGQKKKPAGRPLKYHPEGTERGDHWFSKAKEAHGSDWVRLVKETVGKG